MSTDSQQFDLSLACYLHALSGVAIFLEPEKKIQTLKEITRHFREGNLIQRDMFCYAYGGSGQMERLVYLSNVVRS